MGELNFEFEGVVLCVRRRFVGLSVVRISVWSGSGGSVVIATYPGNQLLSLSLFLSPLLSLSILLSFLLYSIPYPSILDISLSPSLQPSVYVPLRLLPGSSTSSILSQAAASPKRRRECEGARPSLALLCFADSPRAMYEKADEFFPPSCKSTIQTLEIDPLWIKSSILNFWDVWGCLVSDSFTKNVCKQTVLMGWSQIYSKNSWRFLFCWNYFLFFSF